MMRVLTFFFCCLGFGLLGHAQTTAPVLTQATATGPGLAYRAETTTYEAKLNLRRREKTLLGDLDLSGLWGGPTYNYTATGDDWALVRGGFGGLEFSENVFLGYGGWGARENFTTDEAPADGGLRPDYDFRHGGFIIAYSPGADNIIHPRFTAIVGPGRITLSDETLADQGAEANRDDRFFVGQLMGGAELNLFQWFRLGFEGGYRFAGGVENIEGVSASDVSGAVLQIEARFGFSW